MRRVAHQQSFPHERFAFPEQTLAVLIHLGPEPNFIECAVESHLGLRPLDENEVAIARAADAFVPKGFAWDLHCGPSVRDVKTGPGE